MSQPKRLLDVEEAASLREIRATISPKKSFGASASEIGDCEALETVMVTKFVEGPKRHQPDICSIRYA
jgi:hypothetical protein